MNRAPLRISFFGGGTDSPEFVARYGCGCVLGMTIDKYVYADGSCDVPMGTGLGSSSALEVARRMGQGLTPAELARQAWEAERASGSLVGWQDATFAAHPGLNYIEFRADGPTVFPLTCPWLDELHASLLLLYTGVQRRAEVYERQTIAALPSRGILLGMMRNQAREMRPHMEGDVPHVRLLGDQLRLAWRFKSSLTPQSPWLDRIDDAGREAGAWGGKLLGAGGGGYFLFVVPPEKRQAVIDATGLEELTFSPSWKSEAMSC